MTRECVANVQFMKRIDTLLNFYCHFYNFQNLNCVTVIALLCPRAHVDTRNNDLLQSVTYFVAFLAAPGPCFFHFPLRSLFYNSLTLIFLGVFFFLIAMTTVTL